MNRALFNDPRGPTALAAATLPSLLAFNVAPSPTFLNQALALTLWGWFCCACSLAAAGGRPMRDLRAAAWPLAALLLLAAAAGISATFGPLPPSLGLSSLALLGAAMLLLVCGTACRGDPWTFAAFAWGWVGAGVANVLIALVQVFQPGWTDGDWIAISAVAGRAIGNLRQPNHLASLLLWSMVAVAALVDLGRLRRSAGALLAVAFVLGLVLSASRTGLVGVVLLALWALLDRRLQTPTRAALLAAPLVYAALWWLMASLAQAPETGGTAFYGQQRLAEGDISASRFRIWSDTLALIRAEPLAGVGFGVFNFAWSLTPLPQRPIAFFDHTHNLPLQLWVELGLPLGTLVLVLLVGALVLAWRRPMAWASGDARGTAGRAAAVMIVTIGLHSLLEYPLWYSYFLLPAAWACGFALGAGKEDEVTMPASLRWAPVLLAGGALLSIGAAASVADYVKVVRVFSAAPEPLAERIAAGQRSIFFAHHADYAEATTREADAAAPLAPFHSSSFHLLDTRLMTAWAENLAAHGQLDHARHLAARLREFRNKASEPFFAPCADAAPGQRPFQCDPPGQRLDWRDFLPPR